LFGPRPRPGEEYRSETIREVYPTLDPNETESASKIQYYVADAQGHSGRVTLVAFSPDGKVVHALFVSDDWVAEGRGGILRLPPDYRATSVAVWNGIVALRHSSTVGGFPFSI
jgi:hypothetical protein